MAIEHALGGTWIDDDGVCLGCYGIAEMTFHCVRICDACLGLPVRLPPPRDELTPQRLNARKGAEKMRVAARQLAAKNEDRDDE